MTGELEKRIYLKAGLIAIIIVAIGIILGFGRFSLGIAVGTITSIFNFKLLAIRTNIITSSKRVPNPFFIIASYLSRLLLMGAVLWIAIMRGVDVFIGAAIGLFTVTIAIYVDSFSRKTADGKSSYTAGR